MVANILPKQIHNLVRLYLEGQVKASRDLQLKMNGLIHSLFIEVNPIPVKTAMNLLGMEVGGFRLPLMEMEPHHVEQLKEELERYGL